MHAGIEQTGGICSQVGTARLSRPTMQEFTICEKCILLILPVSPSQLPRGVRTMRNRRTHNIRVIVYKETKLLISDWKKNFACPVAARAHYTWRIEEVEDSGIMNLRL